MKKFKTFTTLLLAVATIFALSLAPTNAHAQTRTSTLPGIQQGQYFDFGGYNLVPSDSLQVTDTIAYIIPMTHLNDITGYLSWFWHKIGAGTATVTMAFFQGNDPTNFYPVLTGTTTSASYTKSYTLSADTWSNVSFARDSARLEGRYLKVELFTSNTASVKGKIFGRFKTNIK